MKSASAIADGGKIMSYRRQILKAGKLIAGALIFLFATQCKADQPSGDATTAAGPSSVHAMQCTKIVSKVSHGYQEYSLEKSKDDSIKHSSDCRVAGQFIHEPSGAIKIIIRDIGPKSFKGVSECDRASFTPPAPDGSRRPLSEELVELPFDSQVSVSLYALSRHECLARVFPSFRFDRSLAAEIISMQSLHFLSEKGGYDLSGVETPMAVTPVAVLWRGGNLHAIVCAQFVYGTSDEHRLASSETYQACLSNFSDISAIGEQ